MNNETQLAIHYKQLTKCMANMCGGHFVGKITPAARSLISMALYRCKQCDGKMYIYIYIYMVYVHIYIYILYIYTYYIERGAKVIHDTTCYAYNHSM